MVLPSLKSEDSPCSSFLDDHGMKSTCTTERFLFLQPSTLGCTCLILTHSFICLPNISTPQEEWEKRWKGYSKKVFTAFAKYHAITLVMRSYELIAGKFNDNVTMDKLTMDPFHASLKISARGQSDSKVAQQMFQTTFWANAIAFMADYSIHQAILCYGYYIYVRERRKRLSDGEGEEEEGFNGAVMTSVLKKSTQLMVSRGFGLFCSSVGGAVGTVVYPGWGTLLLSSMGEGASGALLDDGTAAAKKQ
jgi:hypothetical protein